MKFRFFQEVKDSEDLKKKYRSNVKALHPDANPGKSDREFKEMVKEYEELLFTKDYSKTFIKGFKTTSLRGKEKIESLYDQALLKGWKVASVYFSYKEYLLIMGIEPELEDLQYLGELLNYSSKWAVIKYNEIMGELNKIQ